MPTNPTAFIAPQARGEQLPRRLGGAAVMREWLRVFHRWAKGWDTSIIVAVLIWIVLRSYLIEAFRIPSASMENTLLVGDFLFVNKAIYGGELEIPLTGVRFWRLPGYAEPRRDGIVVFRSVEDSTPNLNIVKRVIGVAGDTLRMARDTVYRDGKRLDEPYALHTGSMPDPDFRLQQIRAWQLPHYIGRDAEHYHPTTHDWGPVVVPPGHYFVMGQPGRVVRQPLLGFPAALPHRRPAADHLSECGERSVAHPLEPDAAAALVKP